MLRGQDQIRIQYLFMPQSRRGSDKICEQAGGGGLAKLLLFQAQHPSNDGFIKSISL
jgi:hypothetical protein